MQTNQYQLMMQTSFPHSPFLRSIAKPHLITSYLNLSQPIVDCSNTDNFSVTLSNGEASTTVEDPHSFSNQTRHEKTQTIIVSEISGKCKKCCG